MYNIYITNNNISKRIIKLINLFQKLFSQKKEFMQKEILMKQSTKWTKRYLKF